MSRTIDKHAAKVSELAGTARKLVVDGVPRQEALAAIRAIAEGSTADLVEAGATEAGTWFGDSNSDPGGIKLATAALLLSAGVRVDSKDVRRWVQVGYERTHHSHYSA